jgi:hypothetical protein
MIPASTSNAIQKILRKNSAAETASFIISRTPKVSSASPLGHQQSKEILEHNQNKQKTP